jgi:N-acetylglutamate synthase-like GNAT family acetyltransferase
MHNIKIEEYFKHDNLVDLYISRDIEFDDNKEYQNKPIFSYIAIVDDKIIGAATCCKDANEDKYYILDDIVVLPEFEGQGIGTKLLNVVLNRISQLGGSEVYIIAKVPDFFAKNGFKEIKREEAPDFSVCFTCDKYQKKCFPKVMKKEIK